MMKDEIRVRHKLLRNSISQTEHENLCKNLSTLLFQTKAYKECDLLFTYVSFGSEVDTKNIIKKAIVDGKRVFAPRVEVQNMEFYEIHELESLIYSRYGIAEPHPSKESRYKGLENEKSKLMLLPGLAFDLNGNRIGYGAGYYDRYLFTHLQTHFYKIALAFDFQIIDKIDTDEHDIKADALLSPTHFINIINEWK